MPKTKVIHSSGRFDRPNNVVRRALFALRNERGVTVVTGTEAKHRKDHALQHPDWVLVHESGWHGECWLSYDPSEWEKAGPFRTKKLSGQTFVRSKAYGGHEAKPVDVLLAPLRNKRTGRKVVFIVGHLMLDNTEKRAKIWIDDAEVLVHIIRGLRRGNRKHGHPVNIVFNADLNKNFRQARERWMVQHHIAGPARLTQAWRVHVPRKGGTHHHALIDDTLTDLKVRGIRLIKRTGLQRRASDHNPYIVTLEV